MPSVPLHFRPAPNSTPLPAHNPLPPLLQTPSGLALIELQGSLNLPTTTTTTADATAPTLPVGRLEFPPESSSKTAADTSWMKSVYLYVGQHQRLLGEVKKLPKPMAIVQRRAARSGEDVSGGDGGGGDELEIVEIVRWKILFGVRPEPVGSAVKVEDGEQEEGETMEIDDAT